MSIFEYTLTLVIPLAAVNLRNLEQKGNLT